MNRKLTMQIANWSGKSLPSYWITIQCLSFNNPRWDLFLIKALRVFLSKLAVVVDLATVVQALVDYILFLLENPLSRKAGTAMGNRQS